MSVSVRSGAGSPTCSPTAGCVAWVVSLLAGRGVLTDGWGLAGGVLAHEDVTRRRSTINELNETSFFMLTSELFFCSLKTIKHYVQMLFKED